MTVELWTQIESPKFQPTGSRQSAGKMTGREQKNVLHPSTSCIDIALLEDLWFKILK